MEWVLNVRPILVVHLLSPTCPGTGPRDIQAESARIRPLAAHPVLQKKRPQEPRPEAALNPFGAVSLCRSRPFQRELIIVCKPVIKSSHLVRLSAVRTIDFRQVQLIERSDVHFDARGDLLSIGRTNED